VTSGTGGFIPLSRRSSNGTETFAKRLEAGSDALGWDFAKDEIALSRSSVSPARPRVLLNAAIQSPMSQPLDAIQPYRIPSVISKM
jgi:hypothetical protein